MSVNRISIDGLWRCLCPSIDTIALSAATRSPSRPRKHSSARLPPAACLQARQLSTTNLKDNGNKGPRIRFHGSVSKAGDKGATVIRFNPANSGLENTDSDSKPLVPDAIKRREDLLKRETKEAEKKARRDARLSQTSTGAIARKDRTHEVRTVKLAADGSDITLGALGEQDASSREMEGIPDGVLSENLKDDQEVTQVMQRLFGESLTKTSPGPNSNTALGTWGGMLNDGTGLKDIGEQVDRERNRGGVPGSWKSNVPVASDSHKLVKPDTTNERHLNAMRAERTVTPPQVGETTRLVDVASGLSKLTKSWRGHSNDQIRQSGSSFTSIHPAQESPAKRFSIRPETKDGFSKANAVAQRQVKLSMRASVALSRRQQWDSEDMRTLHDRLRACRAEEAQFDQVVDLVEYLLKGRGEQPSLIHYDSLIRANADAEKGSAESVRALLNEMKVEGIKGDSGLYHGALQALAIHPDYALRAEIMHDMKERWFGLSPEGWHSLVIGLLRDRQIEMALDKLDQMHNDEIVVQPWLYDIFTYMLCELGEFDEAYSILLYRYEQARFGISQSHWQYLLDRFSNASHYAATKQIWDTRVQAADLIPSDGTCGAILDVAARNSDPALATSVIKVLSARQTPLSPYHYEALIAAYTGIEDLKTTFRVLAIMEKAGLAPTSASTRPLFAYLSTSEKLCHDAWNTTSQLRKDGHVIPLTAVNVILEALNSLTKVEEAFVYYKRLHEICPRGPNTETINVVLQGLQRTQDATIGAPKEKAMFLASEMQALKIRPDMLTYDRLIRVCLTEHDYEDAFRYLEEMEEVGRESVGHGQSGWWMRQGTAARMIQVLADHGDRRAWDIMAEMEKRGLLVKVSLREHVQKRWEQFQSSRTEQDIGREAENCRGL